MQAKLIRFGSACVLAASLAFASLAAPATQATAAPPQENKSAPAKPKRRTAKKRAETGIPKGVPNCINALATMAEADPLVAYEGRPSQIINNGLLWNDPKSKCSIGNDNNLRLKLLELSNAWRTKDAVKVRALVQEVKTAAPPA
jgi:hypothetical protein